ncbi:AMP-binding protein [Palleronia caenipelagi]|uniref:Long-chain-fatty-acid--CoA ligase n=1 Tax=Palleronia caenipelagi TaxID=2489174 RepID=A0A547Q5H0_9RHOB|nr:AMP-binding protein [Palleronia caenipelagi]TRD21636.1 AMP-binding protein [Palleronia caenipelagi]
MNKIYTTDMSRSAEEVSAGYSSVAELFREAVKKNGDKVMFECFGTSMTYDEVDEAADSFAAWLQQDLGVVKGDRIALMCPNVFAFPIAMHGIIRAGGCQVNVNPLYTPREMAHQLNDSGAETIVIFGGSTPVLAEVLAETPVKNVVTVDLADGTDLSIPSPAVDTRLKNYTRFADALKKGQSLPFEPVRLTGDDLLFLQYTGGTTGPSKGATLSHSNLVANTAQFKSSLAEACVEGEEVLVLALPLYHIFGLMVMLTYSTIGARMVLIPNPRDMDGFIDAIKDAGLTVLPGVNTMFQGLSAHSRIKEVDLSNYKLAVGGGAAVIEDTSNRWKALTGHHIKEAYGMSETSPAVSLTPVHEPTFTGTCGKLCAGTEVRLLDDDGNDVPLGEAGELAIRGPQVMSGYWQKDEANAKSFTPDGFFLTGDVAVISENGYIKIVDRKKDMVIVSGFNVYPNEIEATVTACDGVAECACIGVPDAKSGEALRVYAVKEAGADLTAEQVTNHCRNELTGYKVPRQIVFVDELPKSNVGKILRRELRDMALKS